ncbi:MAG: HAMP domain-containing protein [Gammaproteobacteria bacterium]|nr:HAMP domain-containing protein [Gammaproteobacteria bacterium]
MNRTLRNVVSFLAMATLLLVSLYLISDATSNTATFGRYYIWLVFFNAAGLVVLLALIVYNVYRLIVQYRLKTIGSHLTARMIGVFVLLTIIPVSIVYYFSLSFLHRSIDSWFDVGIETALEDSLQLGRRAVDLRKREALNKTREIAVEISELDDTVLVVYLDQARDQYNATELSLVDHAQSILASSSIDSTALPTALSLTDVGELNADNHYLRLVEDPVYGLAIRIAVSVQSSDATEKAKTLQALYPFTDRLNELTVGVQAAFDQYKELAVLRNPLKTSFTLALSLIWLMSVLTAIWVAFVAARKLVAPINDLVEGTKAVAAGDYEKQLAVSGTDELGFLLRSFNTMTRKISRSRAIAAQSQSTEAAQKSYLESVMAHINSGVLTIDETGFIKSGNPAACSIFDIESRYFSEFYVADVVEQYPKLRSFFEAVTSHIQSADEWQEEVIVFGQSGRKILRLRGTALQSQVDERREHVIVVDDVTQLIQAQKDSAWSEMARRLAHEIKNPLTPIQLSAERLQRKLGGEVSPEKRVMLDRYTHTIVQQVEAMKSMVNAFTDYARSPAQKPEVLDFNHMLEAISVLYHANNTDVSLQLDLEKSLPPILADGVRLRQLVHNLIKNSLETIEESGWIKLQTRCHKEQERHFVEFVVEDSGDGVASEVMDNLFEPYVTTKTTGSGLGLAIVQKIVDEHNGVVWVEKSQSGGARFIVRLPLLLPGNESGQDEVTETAAMPDDVRVMP